MSQEFGEILQRLWSQNWDLDMTVLPTSVPSMDTIGTGFLTYQLAMGPNPPGTVMYVNTAPRKERKTAMSNNAGEKLVWVKLKPHRPSDATRPGVELVAVNSGYTLSLLRNDIVEFRRLKVPHEGSQFRSRDFFPESVVMWTDGFGNIKTSIRRSAGQAMWSAGQKVHIRIGGRRKLFS